MQLKSLTKPPAVQLSSIAAALLLGGCGASEPVAATPTTTASSAVLTNDELMPLKAGNKWVYAVEDVGQPAGELTWGVKSALKHGSETDAEIEIQRNGKVIEQQIWRRTTTGLYQVQGGVGKIKNDPPQPLFVAPLKQGSVFKYEGIGLLPRSHQGRIDMTGEILGWQEVDTAMGRMKAVAIETRSTYRAPAGSMKSVTTSWYKPGVGLVRYRMELERSGATTLRLKSTNVK